MSVKFEKTHLRVDEATIAGGDHRAIIQPVWWTATIHEGPAEYERTLSLFSRAQREVFALEWYIAEVNIGGHRQFYANSTGIVWHDALEAFRAIGAVGHADVLLRSARRLGGSPSPEREDRVRLMDEINADFDDLDQEFQAVQVSENLDQLVMRYIRNHAGDFYFDGTVEMPVRPAR